MFAFALGQPIVHSRTMKKREAHPRVPFSSSKKDRARLSQKDILPHFTEKKSIIERFKTLEEENRIPLIPGMFEEQENLWFDPKTGRRGCIIRSRHGSKQQQRRTGIPTSTPDKTLEEENIIPLIPGMFEEQENYMRDPQTGEGCIRGFQLNSQLPLRRHRLPIDSQDQTMEKERYSPSVCACFRHPCTSCQKYNQRRAKKGSIIP